MRFLIQGLAIATLAVLGASPVRGDDGIVLKITKSPPANLATLQWTGSIPNFDVFRADTPATVDDPSHLIIVMGARQTQDATLPDPGGCLFYLVTSVGPCAPLSPAAICGGAERCYATEDTLTSCSGPVGGGAQCAACASDAECSPVHVCIPVPAGGRCEKWCRIGFSFDCTFGSVCLPLANPVFAGAQQYGVCACP
jgi:hypothetical protein